MSSPTTSPTALITGVTGQDGFYLARLLMARGFGVVGGVRDPNSPAARMAAAALPGLRMIPFDLLDPGSMRERLGDCRPSQIFHLAGKSSVARGWEAPLETFRVNLDGTLGLLEAMRGAAPGATLVFAGSGDCFDHAAVGATGLTPRAPILCPNVYAVSKAAALQCVQLYRERHGLRCCVAVMMNHTSPRRTSLFVERKIVREAVLISRGSTAPLQLGSLETARDWSWAEDIVEGLAALGAAERPGDYVLASGRVRTTGDWVRLVFGELGLDWTRHVEVDPTLLHPGDRPHTFGDIAPAARDLGWSPRTSFEEMARRLLASELGGEAPPPED